MCYLSCKKSNLVFDSSLQSTSALLQSFLPFWWPGGYLLVANFAKNSVRFGRKWQVNNVVSDY